MLSPRPRVRLGPLTTLGVGGDASFVVDATDEKLVLEAFRWAKLRAMPVRVLGGGSNVVVGDGGFDGLVVRMLTRGLGFAREGDELVLQVAAGEPWDELVRESVARDAQGLECLSGIPGLAGATPIQNVGAYGQEVAETIRDVRVLDRETLETVSFDSAACGFAYRDSFFKSAEPERYVVLGVTFRLRLGAAPNVRYGELSQKLASDGGEPTLARVREAVLTLRRGKSMVLAANDENGRSCGSFFVNPVVTSERAAAVEALAGDARMPRYPQPDGSVKLAAGWLIERAGFAKGTRRGTVGLSTKHALAIVAHDGASAADVLAFAREIQSTVRARLGVELTPEPVFWGI